MAQIQDSHMELIKTLRGQLTEYDPFRSPVGEGSSVYTLNQWDYWDNVFTKSNFAKRIVSRPAHDVTRTDYHIKQGKSVFGIDDLKSDQDKLKFRSKVKEAFHTKRLYGGALLLADTGLPLDKPLNYREVRKIKQLLVIEPRDANPVVRSRRTRRNPDYYYISDDEHVGLGKVHKSHVYRLDGDWTPQRIFERNGYWNTSSLMSGIDDLRRVYVTRHNLEKFVRRASQRVMKVDDKNQRLTDAKYRSQMMEYVRSVQEYLDNDGVAVIDAASALENLTLGTRGLELFDAVFVDAVVHGYDIPREIILNETTGGLNSGSNEGATRSYYDWIDAYRRSDLEPLLRWFLKLQFAATESRGIIRPAHYQIEFEALWQETDEQRIARESAELDIQLKKVDLEMRREELRQMREGGLDIDGGAELLGDDEEDEDDPSKAPRDLVSARELAGEFGGDIKTRTITRLAQTNGLFMRRIGRRSMVSRSEVLAFMKGEGFEEDDDADEAGALAVHSAAPVDLG